MPPRKRAAPEDTGAEPSEKREKSEPFAPEQTSILDELQKRGQPAVIEDLCSKLKFSLEDFMKHVQPLINTGHIVLSETQTSQGSALAVELGDDRSKKLSSLSPEERLLYTIIEESNTLGIWLKDLKAKSGLDQKKITKITKRLVRDQFIKTVTSVMSTKKTRYMIFELQPDDTVSGGIWYTEDEFDVTFVDALRQAGEVFLRTKAQSKADSPLQRYQQSFVTAAEVLQFMIDKKIVSAGLALRESDVVQILDTLVYDGTAKSKLNPSGPGKLYRYAKTSSTPSIIQSVPCGVCKVRKSCSPRGVISPATCKYYTDWLQAF